ncbi:carboxylating nicotinate-nucleotide diphosphorylase [Neobacillus sp.]|uniref:carboxylating nicotinate-nucleotide diphosphorylase n=1 Tax=Neobacillus sp. TaxID=2675273 RepID=UPI002899D2B8|nr:carboxylating nicotinate-nucleotide diphosphorylase [Neobacillus sp.]
MNALKLRSLLEKFFIEDIGEQDMTTDLIFSDSTNGEIVFLAKDDGVFCGEEIIKIGFQLLNNEISTQVLVKDGETIKIGQQLALVSGKIADLLKGERVILNLVQRMSGIATLTQKAVNTLNSDHTKICDTRKTTPGLRMLEKYAVRCGGGFNHRFGLYDGVMIKDNHISFAGSIWRAVESVRKNAGHMVKIEVEVETAEQVVEAVNAGVDVIMFDNRTPVEIKEFIKLVPSGIITEASGGIQVSNLAAYGDLGVDYISLGFLTHSVKALDISVKVKWNKGEE